MGLVGVGWEWEVQEGRAICVLVADSRCCMVEVNTILQSNDPPILKSFFKVQREKMHELSCFTPISQMQKLRHSKGNDLPKAAAAERCSSGGRKAGTLPGCARYQAP